MFVATTFWIFSNGGMPLGRRAWSDGVGVAMTLGGDDARKWENKPTNRTRIAGLYIPC
jgi:hypothetical protein